MIILRVTKKQSLTVSPDSIFFRLNFNISFCQIINLSFYFNKSICPQTLYAKMLAHERDHVWQFYGNCHTLP